MSNLINNRPNRLQPYISWKGSQININNTRTSIVPTNSKPLTKADNSENPMNRRPNPIKHWRKQLIPRIGSGHGKVSVGLAMDRPGGSHLVKDNCSLIKLDPCPNNIKSYIEKVDNSGLSGICTKTFCNNQRITRSASTKINKNYFTTNKEYLRSRVRLYNQNQTIAPKSGNTYLDNTTFPPTLLPASNSTTGSQVYNSTNCYDISYCTISPISVIYKPNNVTFSKQGAVSSSLRIQKIKYNTVTKSAKNLEIPWGSDASKDAKYRGDYDAIYINKSKFNLPIQDLRYKSISGRQPSGGVGHHNVCCGIHTTSNSALARKTGSILNSVKGAGTGILIPKQNANECDANGYTNNNNNILNKNRFLRNRSGCRPDVANCKKWCVVPPISQIKTITTIYF